MVAICLSPVPCGSKLMPPVCTPPYRALRDNPPQIYDSQPSRSRAPPQQTQPSQPPTKDPRETRRGKRPANQSSIDVFVDDEEDPKEIGSDRGLDSSWKHVLEDFNAKSHVQCKKDKITRKWVTMNGNYQRFNAIYKCFQHTGIPSGETEADHMGRCKMGLSEESNMGNKKFTQEHPWRILKTRPEWDSSEPVNLDNPTRHPELFGSDPRERPPGKPRKAKKPNRTPRRASRVVTRKIY
ncbi:hypothetical protein Tco_0681362 [Tanacetum coccineum]|uniref:No apical meristem-associated C-terminal domain-containing protein n=1 Tax=Tanacetum coccineum TaxID=301880 RepID=A0ABQ4XPG2_9ASTR